MNQQLKAYEQSQKSNLTPRDAEATALTKAAVMMEDAKNKVEDKDIFTKAVRFNHLLWTILQADIAEKENKLPEQLKANIMSLSIFVDKQTTKALQEYNYSVLEAMIDINKNLAAGLRVNDASSDMQAASA
ncbi:MAG: flagellar biosynthesis regulator FlaF [Alphaproteobacteria bacterium]|nr:flagellar biosynthesis regulator FlaF [Alphaproteobacteria bacterium]